MSNQLPNKQEADAKGSPTQDRKMKETKLSIPTKWKLANEDRYVYAYHNSQSPKLAINQISLYGMELTKARNNSLQATGLVRSTVQRTVKFDATVIILFGPDKEVIAKQEFDLKKIGNIPPNGARPWTFEFPVEAVISDINLPLSSWSLAFELKTKHQLDLEDSWEKTIAEDTRAKLQELVTNAPSLKPGEVNFMGISARQDEDFDLSVTILIRNGTDKDITLEQIPLGISDASGEEIVRGGFKLTDFTVKANTSKPWTFIFPASTITTKEIDLSKWKAYAIQK